MHTALDVKNRAHNDSHAESSVSERQRMGVWLYVLSATVVLVIFFGGIARLTGAGQAIPDWPLIQGKLLPPLNESDWLLAYKDFYAHAYSLDVTGPGDINMPQLMALSHFQGLFAVEYLHRLMVAILSIVFLAVFVRVQKNPGLRRELGFRFVAMALLLLLQAAMGGVVDKLDLRGDLVAFHLSLAFAFFGWVLWTAKELVSKRHSRPMASSPFGLFAAFCLILVFVQVVSGALVASTRAGYLFNTWPKMGDHMLPPLEILWSGRFDPSYLNVFHNPIFVQFFHRWWAFLTLAFIVGLLFIGNRVSTSKRIHSMLRVLGSVVAFQVLLGVATLILKVEPVLAIAHLMMGVLTFGVLVNLVFEVDYHA